MPNAKTDPLATFFNGMAAKDRQNVEKHLAAIDAESTPLHGKTWRRLAATLRRLAPGPVQTVGQQVVQFYIPDGKYRMQVFTLEDRREGTMLLFLPDVLEEATKAKVLGKPPRGARSAADDENDEAGADDAGIEYPLAGKKTETLTIHAMSDANTPEPPPHVRHMLGWNRKALRITIPAAAPPALVSAVESLCEIASRAWAERVKA